MSKPIVVYVSGPLTTGELGPWHNMHAAFEVGARLFALGYSAIVPHWTWVVEQKANLSHAEWIERDNAILERCDVVFRLPGRSSGADLECEHARACGVPVVMSFDELAAIAPPARPQTLAHTQPARGTAPAA